MGATIDSKVLPNKSVAEQVRNPQELLRMIQGEPEQKAPKKMENPVDRVLSYLNNSVPDYVRKETDEDPHIVVKPKDGVFEDTMGYDPDKEDDSKAPPAICYEQPRLPVTREWIDVAMNSGLRANIFELYGGNSQFYIPTTKNLNAGDFAFLLN